MDLPPTLPARIRDHVTARPSGCWSWGMAHKDTGYGVVWLNGRSQGVHRVLYEAMRGPVPDGLVLDHVVCSDRSCCNPFHLTPTTNEQNITRERREKTTCVHGHTDLRVKTVKGKPRRYCAECARAYAFAQQRAKRGVPLDHPRHVHYRQDTP